ncbi:MAG TPA: branched-chain amino acid ABC transporter permease [Mycobacteriales bacterium]|nr:branched-chain amino acid ABC transporter permease [Mycobacteriales bacterium]
MLLSQIITGLAIGALYSLVAVAVVLVYSGTRVLSLAMGEIGAFGLFLALRWSDHGVPLVGWRPSPLVVGLIAVVAGALLGLVVERLVIRPLVTRPAFDALVATLGVALFLALLEVQLFDAINPVTVPSPVGTGRLEVLGATLFAPLVASLILAVVVAGGLYLLLNRTRFGLSTRAATGDPTVARLLGVDVQQVYRFTWGVGGALSGLAAALNTPTGGLVPFGQTTFALGALAGAVIGGLDSLGGAVAGSLLVGVVTGIVAPRYGAGGTAAAVLILVLGTLLLRPRGLFGTARTA